MLRGQKPLRCKDCGETAPSEFRWVTRKATGEPRQVRNQCNSCNRKMQRDRYRAESAQVAERVLFQKFGVTRDEYDAQLERQENRCTGCGRTREDDIENRGRRWPVDHDHETDAVRGILCWLCNLALGAVRDEPDTLRRLADYVEQGGVWNGT